VFFEGVMNLSAKTYKMDFSHPQSNRKTSVDVLGNQSTGSARGKQVKTRTF
jgi:hypothetical protein